MPTAMTEQIKKKLRDELNTLEHELAFDIPKEIKKAVAMGDLSENAEYHMAKQRQEYLKARVRQLGKRLADLSLINLNNIPKDKVGLGSTVTIYDGTNGVQAFRRSAPFFRMIPKSAVAVFGKDHAQISGGDWTGFLEA